MSAVFHGPVPGHWRPSRRALLFLVAIGLPCALLVGLSLRILAQDRELAEKRLADARRRVAGEISQELLTRLERLRRDAVNGPSASFRAGSPRDPLVLVARINGSQLVLPWEGRTDASTVAATLEEPDFAAHIRAGERSELVEQRFEAAADSYRRALERAGVPSQKAYAELLAGRALAKAGRAADARATNARLLATPPHVLDEQGIPFALYAARRLAESGSPVREAVRTTCAAAALSPAIIYMCSDLLGGEDERIAAVRRDLEQALALQRAFATLGGQAAAGGPAREVAWVPFGPPDGWWLAGISLSADDSSLVALRAAPVLASQASVQSALRGGDAGRLRAVHVAADGEPLGADFPGVALAFDAIDAEALSAGGSLQRSFYLAALSLVISMAVFGAYLFWRDVQRDVRVAAMRTQFVSSVSHELKTPLTAIRMFAETLLMGRSTHASVREEYLQTIVNESERLTRLLNNVLDFSNIEQGRKSYRLEPHLLGAIVSSAARVMEYPFAQLGFELRFDLAAAIPDVPVDADAIQQAVLNLLSNAMKYSAGGHVIDLRVTREGTHAVIAVTDRGLGIPSAEHGRIFEKFYRVTGPDRDRIPGTGLGLTLVDHIVKGHRGTVTVTSAPGEGSTFSIRLPIEPADAGAPAAEEALA